MGMTSFEDVWQSSHPAVPANGPRTFKEGRQGFLLETRLTSGPTEHNDPSGWAVSQRGRATWFKVQVPRSEETHARGQKVASKAAWWGISTRRLATSRRCPRTQKKHTPEAGQKSHLKGCLGGHLYAQARNLASVPVDPKRDTRQGRVPVIAKVIRSKGSLAKNSKSAPANQGLRADGWFRRPGVGFSLVWYPQIAGLRIGRGLASPLVD